MRVTLAVSGTTLMKTRVYVTLKNGVLDPQGKAIHHALEGLGFTGIHGVRAGKLIELDLADDVSEEAIEAMCRKLLANTVIENFRIEREMREAAE
jgi:phosphoribosylformylglycinamidine synthase